MKNILILIAVVSAFCIGFIYSNAMTVLPKDVSTANSLVVLEREIRIFAESNGRLPNCLQELIDTGYSDQNLLKDRWGEEIEYVVVDTNIVSLITKGNPSIRHKHGFNCAISNTFSVRLNQHEGQF